MLIPKKLKTYFPIKKEMIRIKNTFMEVHNEILEHSCLESPWVRPTKIGTVPIGFNTENKATNK
ncbi:hypothetical protein D3C85_1749470 [compost metagenome]